MEKTPTSSKGHLIVQARADAEHLAPVTLTETEADHSRTKIIQRGDLVMFRVLQTTLLK